MGNQGGKKKVTSRVAGFVLVIFGFFQFQSFYRQFHSIHSFIHHHASSLIGLLFWEKRYIGSNRNQIVLFVWTCRARYRYIRRSGIPDRSVCSTSPLAFEPIFSLGPALSSQKLLSLRLSLWTDTLKNKTNTKRMEKVDPLNTIGARVLGDQFFLLGHMEPLSNQCACCSVSGAHNITAFSHSHLGEKNSKQNGARVTKPRGVSLRARARGMHA